MKRFALGLLSLAGVLALAGSASAHGYRSSFRGGYGHGSAIYCPPAFYAQPFAVPIYAQPFVVAPFVYPAPVYVPQPVYQQTPQPYIQAPAYQSFNYEQTLRHYGHVEAFARSPYFARLPAIHRDRVFRAFPRLGVSPSRPGVAVRAPGVSVRIGR